MRETIAELLKVEVEARRIVATAESDAEEVLRRARAEAAKLEEEALKEAQVKAAGEIERGVRVAREQREAALARIDRETGRLRDVPRDKAEAARLLILAALTGR